MPNIWQRRMAQRLLTERSDHRTPMSEARGFPVVLGLREVADELETAIFTSQRIEARLAALWTLHGIGPMAVAISELRAGLRGLARTSLID